MIMAAVIANFRSGEVKSQLSLAAQNTASEIRKTQSMSSAGEPTRLCLVAMAVNGVCEDDPASCTGDCVEQFPYGGYGLVFTEGSETITLFANHDATDSYDSDDETVRQIKVSPTGRVRVSDITTDTGDVSSLEVIFTPPKNEMVFAGPEVFGDPDEAAITLEHLSTGETKTITLNKISLRIDVSI